MSLTDFEFVRGFMWAMKRLLLCVAVLLLLVGISYVISGNYVSGGVATVFGFIMILLMYSSSFSRAIARVIFA